MVISCDFPRLFLRFFQYYCGDFLGWIPISEFQGFSGLVPDSSWQFLHPEYTMNLDDRICTSFLVCYHVPCRQDPSPRAAAQLWSGGDCQSGRLADGDVARFRCSTVVGAAGIYPRNPKNLLFFSKNNCVVKVSWYLAIFILHFSWHPIVWDLFAQS